MLYNIDYKRFFIGYWIIKGTGFLSGPSYLSQYNGLRIYTSIFLFPKVNKNVENDTVFYGNAFIRTRYNMWHHLFNGKCISGYRYFDDRVYSLNKNSFSFLYNRFFLWMNDGSPSFVREYFQECIL
jgi:hypothetical protein